MEVPTAESTKSQSNKAYMKAAPKLSPATGSRSHLQLLRRLLFGGNPSGNHKLVLVDWKLEIGYIIKAAMTFISRTRLGSSVVAGGVAENDDDNRACLMNLE